MGFAACTNVAMGRWRRSGSMADGLQHSGVLKCINRDKGYGFIQCDELYKVYEADVFVFARDAPSSVVGDYVKFFVTENERGQPQAREVVAGEAIQALGTSGRHDREERAFVGTVKSYDADRGYGFISCSDTFDLYSRDVFVHSNDLKDFRLGDQVSFSVKLSPMGQPQARKLQPAAQSALWLAEGTSSLDSSVDLLLLGTHVGKVKSIFVSREYGFIHCAELFQRFGCDVFFPASLLLGLTIGQEVSFDARVKRGKLQAHTIVCRSLPVTADVHVRKVERPQAAPAATPEPQSALTKKLVRACASSRKDSYKEMFALLNDGADPNGRDVSGQTALMISALNDGGGEKKCRLLVGMRADVHCAYRDELTVLDWARERISRSFAAHLEALSKGEEIDCLIVLNTMGASEV